MRKIDKFIRDNECELSIFIHKPQINNPNLFSRFRWRMKFIKSEHSENLWLRGRCVSCDAGNPNAECSTYYCPCNVFQNLKKKKPRIGLFQKFSNYLNFGTAINVNQTIAT